MDFLLSLDTLCASHGDDGASVFPAAHAPAAPKRKHRKTHGDGPGQNVDKMENLRLRKKLKQEQDEEDEEDELQAELDQSFVQIGRMRCSMSSLAWFSGDDRRTLAAKLRQHLSVLFYGERLALVNLLGIRLCASEVDRLDASDDEVAVLRKSLLSIDGSRLVLPLVDLPSFDVPSYFAEALEHDETKSHGRDMNAGRDVKGAYSVHVFRHEIASHLCPWLSLSYLCKLEHNVSHHSPARIHDMA